MGGYQFDEASAEDIAAEEATYAPVAAAARRIADLTIRSQVSAADADRARGLLEQAAAILETDVDPDPYGLRISTAGVTRPWGNAVVGVRNPIAPPLTIVHEEDGTTHTEFELGAQYEGPPGLVHGGVSALLLDQLLGEAAAASGRPGMTGTLTLRYRQPTPLGKLTARARMERSEGVKTYVTGHIASGQVVCVEAEGLFILPRWARGDETPKRFE